MLDPQLIKAITADYPGLISLLQRKLHDRALAEDLINQAFAQSLEKLQRNEIADPARFNGFVYRVAYNLMLNHRRRTDNRIRLRVAELPAHAFAYEESAADRCSDERMAAEVRRIIGQMPTLRDRDVVRRFYLDEESKESICRDLQLTPAHFDKVIFRARRRMRDLLQASGMPLADMIQPARRRCVRLEAVGANT